MTKPASIEAWRISRLIARAAPARPLRGFCADTLLSALGFDSYGFVSLCVEIEEAFGITLPCELIGDVRTAGQLVDVTLAAAAALPPATRKETV